MLGRTRVTSSQSPSSDFCERSNYEVVIGENIDQEVDQQVILAKGGKNNPPTNRGPRNFLTPPTSSNQGKPNTPVYVPQYRTTPDIVNPNAGWGLGDNPSGIGSESVLKNYKTNVRFQTKNNSLKQILMSKILFMIRRRRKSEMNI